ncbi:proline iminopeptidase-family hydrolase [Engelhardtia mirabilis]|uniref:Proline iminopeptidase n=1 Tax=Engelhardtia mirabilis TaxID=2528011 RepID=A0A518BGT6_9BACT|nr:Proline iminopeptidase [Planctomycetes bacterium Pla133]QDV00518.1 Proline iminopeptidase [Planctomycetes bacterium Pla86]
MLPTLRGISICVCFALLGCQAPHTAGPSSVHSASESYLDYSDRDDRLNGGVRMVPIEKPKGSFEVWNKRVGNAPKIKVLLLHGGPGLTQEYLEAFDSFLPAAGVVYYYYDQLGSYYSDQPDEPELRELPRFVDEVEQVRQTRGLDADEFYLYRHSWGGMLAIEYALRRQDHLKGLIVSNMMSSIPAYNEYAERFFKETMDPEVLAALQAFESAQDYENPRYMELLYEHHYVEHFLRVPLEQWPEPVNRGFDHLNADIYVPMQGPRELGASGKLATWDRAADLDRITVPTLVIVARHDNMDPVYLEWMAQTVQRGRFLFCPDGSRCALYDDQQVYMDGLIRFLQDVDAGATALAVT